MTVAARMLDTHTVTPADRSVVDSVSRGVTVAARVLDTHAVTPAARSVFDSVSRGVTVAARMLDTHTVAPADRSVFDSVARRRCCFGPGNLLRYRSSYWLLILYSSRS